MSNINILNSIKENAKTQLSIIIEHAAKDEHAGHQALKINNQNINAPIMDSGREIAFITNDLVIDSEGFEYNLDYIFESERIELTLTMIDELDADLREDKNQDYIDYVPFTLGSSYLFTELESYAQNSEDKSIECFGEESCGEEILQIKDENDNCFTFILDSSTVNGYSYKLINIA